MFLRGHSPSQISFPWSSKVPKDWQGLHKLEKRRTNYTFLSKFQLDHHRVMETKMCAREQVCLSCGWHRPRVHLLLGAQATHAVLRNRRCIAQGQRWGTTCSNSKRKSRRPSHKGANSEPQDFLWVGISVVTCR